MSCTYHIERDAFGAYDVLHDAGAGVRLRIRRKGAEMVSLALSTAARESGPPRWIGFLYRDNETAPPPSGWANHATVMGYYIHRLVDQRSSYRGRVIEGGNHGFLRAFDFDAPTFAASEHALRYRLPADAIPAGAYPLRVAMTLCYRLEGSRVHAGFEFTNEEPVESAHLSFGLHPGYAVSSLARAEILLPAGTYVRHFAPANFLDGRIESIRFAGGPMPFDKAFLRDSYLVGLADVPEPSVSLRDAARGTAVHLDLRGVPYMTLWSESDSFLCIEPCWGLPDSIPQKPFEQKDGIQVIPPGGCLRGAFSIQPELL